MRRVSPLSVTMVVAAALALATPASTAVAAPEQTTFTSAQLASTQVALDSLLRTPPAGITGWGVDPATGRVAVSVMASDPSALAAARSAIAALPAATITTVTRRPRPLDNLIGGQVINGNVSVCSIGFSARSKGGSVHVLTAGHCTARNSSWSGYNRVGIGPTVGSNYPTDDFGSILVTNRSWVGTPQVQGSAAVSGSVEAAVGASVCRSGAATGYRCGKIEVKNQTVNYGGGNIVRGLTRTSACAAPGDSGGPFVAGTQAQGVTSGGSGDCATGGTTYFQPVNEILARYDLTLITTK